MPVESPDLTFPVSSDEPPGSGNPSVRRDPLLMHRLRTLLTRLPLTLRGFLLALVSGAALGVWGSIDLVLLVVGGLGLAVLVLATVLVAAGTLWIRRHLPETPPDTSTLVAESRIRTGFSLPALDRIPLLRLDWQWITPRDVDCHLRWRDGRWDEEVVAHRRTAGTRLERRIEVGDVLGLVRMSWTLETHSGPRIYPSVGRLRSAPVVQAFSASEGVSHPLGRPEGDRMEIRRYVPGDPARDIHWKAFARNRQLNVRLRERSIERSRRTVAYLVRGERDEPAAAAARVALESEAFGPGWSFGADGTDDLVDELPDALLAIARSGDLETDHPTALPSVLDRLAREGRTSCIVFVPGEVGPWTDRTLAALKTFPGAVTLVVATDGLRVDDDTPRWHRWIWKPEPGPTVGTRDLQQLLARLGPSGCPILVVDRPTGRSWSPGPARNREIVA